ncbi:MAG: metallophosphoesterase family protein [Promethearchaeota archaeon]|jgi:DNA repair exonuclease SbcCD nuclease subunit
MSRSSETIIEPHNRSKNSVKFIHASDIHLGCQQYRNQNRADDFIRAFREILAISIEHSVDFIILGGDVFTSLEMLPGKLLEIIDLLTEFKDLTKDEIPIIAIEGNHDIRKFSFGLRLSECGQSWLKLLSSLGLIILLDANLDDPPGELFKLYDFSLKKGGKIQVKNVMIHGFKYIGQDPVKYLPRIKAAIKKEKGIYNILLQHYGIEGKMKNVPGVKLENIELLKDRVNYLALGHFHRQFIVDDWIYNPGSSEAASWIDSTFQRGIFLVEVFTDEVFTKEVQNIRLNNRCHQWEVIFFPKPVRNKQDFYSFIFHKLELVFKYLEPKIKTSDMRIPTLYLVLKGKKPVKSCKINEKELRNRICESFPVVDVKIYQKFTNRVTRLDKYM